MTYTASFTCGNIPATLKSLSIGAEDTKVISEWDDRGTECSCMYVCEYVTTQYVDSVCVCMSSECCSVTASVVPWDNRNVSWNIEVYKVVTFTASNSFL